MLAEEKDEAGSPGSPSGDTPEDKNTNAVKQEKQEVRDTIQ